MLRAFVLNPVAAPGRPTSFPPPECEVCGGYAHADASGVFSALVSYLEETGVAGPFTTAAELPSPAAWNDLPQSAGIEEIVLTGAEAAAAQSRLAGYELDEPAFLDYWLRFLYGGWYDRPAPAGDVAAAAVAQEHLEHLRRVLAAGSGAEWLLVYDMYNT